MSDAPVYVKPYRAISGSLLTTSGGSSPISPGSTNFLLQADAVVEEEANDEMVITDHPVEQGSVISDHAYKLPAELTLLYVWAMGSPQNTDQNITFLNSLYAEFLAIQVTRSFCNVFTGKRIYQRMLIKNINVPTDKEKENILYIRLYMRELLLATTQTLTLGANIAPANNQAIPTKTAPIIPQGAGNLLPGTNFNPGGLVPSGGS